MNNKKEGEHYSQMVRRYKNEYGGNNLQEFCVQDLEKRLTEQQAASEERVRSLTHKKSHVC